MKIIIDGKVANVSSGGVENNVYSEEETVVGTWFGKPLYRRIFTTEVLKNSVTVLLTTEECAEIDTMVSMDGVIMYDGLTFTLPYYYLTSSNAEITKINSYINIALSAQRYGLYLSHIGASITSSQIMSIVIVEYTKTTD